MGWGHWDQGGKGHFPTSDRLETFQQWDGKEGKSIISNLRVSGVTKNQIKKEGYIIRTTTSFKMTDGQ